MPRYEHQNLRKLLTDMDEPSNDPAAFRKWLNASDHLDLLQEDKKGQELIISAMGSHTFIQTAVVKKEKVSPVNQDDLLGWGDHFSLCAGYNYDDKGGGVWIENDNGFSNSRTLESSQRLVFL